MAKDNKNSIQIVWGIALILVGIALFYRIPQVIPRIKEIAYFSSSASVFFVRFCLYLMGIVLIGGGAKKIYAHYGKLDDKLPDNDRSDK